MTVERCIAILFLSLPLAAQTDQTDKLKAEMDHKFFVFSSSGMPGHTITGAPYSADETTTTTQTLADGNRIVNTSTTKVYRDTQGRTRVEHTLNGIGPVAAAQPLVSITISDPVAKTQYSLDPENRTAYKAGGMYEAAMAEDMVVIQKKLNDEHVLLQQQKLKDEAAQVQGVRTNTLAFSYSTTTSRDTKPAVQEDLGTSNMSGVPVKGSRTTRTIPAGSIGNERDINIVEERWYSSDLQMNIMTKRTDPRSGETVFQVNNLTRNNPDPSLFQVPPDYQVKEGPQRLLRDAVRKD